MLLYGLVCEPHGKLEKKHRLCHTNDYITIFPNLAKQIFAYMETEQPVF